MSERWIQQAVKQPGRLRAYVRRVYGRARFTEEGTIRLQVLRDLVKRQDEIGRATRLALTLRKLK
jgi:hypothetical protein